MPHTPLSSSDTTIRRWTSWPQTGKKQTITISLSAKKKVTSFGVYWYDDREAIDPPGRWHLEYQSPDGWKRVTLRKDGSYGTRPNRYNTAHLEVPVATKTLRIVVTPRRADLCVGILAVTIEAEPVASPRTHANESK